MDIKALNEKLEQFLEIAVERYLSVYPKEDGVYVALVEGNKEIQEFSLETTFAGGLTEEDIIEAAKQHFDNITDDIRVQWY